MKRRILNLGKDDEMYAPYREEYENGKELNLKKDNYIINAGEYLYVENGNLYALTNIYFTREDFQKYIDSGDIVKINSKDFHLYKVNNPINVKAIRECLNPHITSYNLVEDRYVEFDPNNIESYL